MSQLGELNLDSGRQIGLQSDGKLQTDKIKKKEEALQKAKAALNEKQVKEKSGGMSPVKKGKTSQN